MEKIIEMGHNKSLNELKPELFKKIESLRDQYSQKISLYGIQHFWNKENDVLIVHCDKYGIKWYMVVSPSIMQIYEEAPAYIKPFLIGYRNQFLNIIKNELQEIIN